MNLTPFEFHTGFAFRQIKGHPEPIDKHQWRGHCPFCRKPDHFFFGITDLFGWDCKHCGLKGNIYTFIKHIHQDVCTEDLQLVYANERGIDIRYIRRNQVRWNPLNQSFVIPTTNSKGTINYLYKLSMMDGKRRVINMPGIDPTLFNWPEKIHDTVWLCEGLTDKMAAEEIVGDRLITCMGFPGSNFKQSWTNALSDKDVVILTDNDEAGERHFKLIMERVKTAPSKPRSIRRLIWPEGTPKKYDVNDVLRDKKFDSFTFITKHLHDVDIQNVSVSNSVEVIPDPTAKQFNDIRTSCKEYYHYTLDMDRLLVLMATAVYALKIDGEQIWLRVIAPPGSFKSTACKIIGSSEQTVLQSTFTGLFSGWKDDDPSDASLVPIIAGKALIVKDADALLQQPNKEQIFSQLRDFYDKTSKVTYMNRVSLSYDNVRSAFIFCGTHALRGMDNSALGERFVDYELHVSDEDRDIIAAMCSDRANNMDNPEVSNKESAIFRKAKNFIDNELFQRNDIVRLTKDERSIIEEQCKLAAFMRAKVERNRNGEVLYKPHAETPSRLVGQLTKLANCIPIVLNENSVTDETMQIVSKVVADVIDTSSLRFRIGELMTVAGYQSLLHLTQMFDFPQRAIERELDNMRLLNMLEIKKAAIGTNTGIMMAKLKPNLENQMKIVRESLRL